MKTAVDPREALASCVWSEAQVEDGFLAAIIEHVAHPIFVKDRQFRFVVLNAALSALVGVPREKMLGRTDYDFFSKAEADFFRAKDEETFAGGRMVDITEENITDASGGRHVLSTTKVPLRSRDGTVTHLVGIIHDITLLKRADEALRRANEALESRIDERTSALEIAQGELLRRERLAVVGQLAGSVAHQIRNPLGSMKNAAYLVQLALGTEVPDDVSRAVAIIHDEVARANQIITELLDFARVQPPRRRPTQLGYLVEQAVGATEIPERIEVERVLPDDLPAVLVDAGQVQRALFNLVRNAVQAMEGPGRLSIRARPHAGFVVVEVADTGGGICPEVRDRLFEPMVTNNPGALGLGLMTARALVENQEGTLSCRESGSEGTVFVLELPAVPPRGAPISGA